MADENEQSWDLLGNLIPGRPPAAPKPDATWPLQGGTAWVYLANSRMGLVRPVILSDGFHDGGTKLDEMYDGLEGGNDYKFISDLRRRGHDLIILGYDDCTVSMLDNAKAATECIMRTIGERVGNAPLSVGGFSMGGLITRYALARLEMMRMDHQTAAYICYDSPHRGAWMPISIQALAHSLTKLPALSRQVNSPASRELLWRHLESLDATPREDPLRTEFLKQLGALGGWPQRPRKIGVANGTGTGRNAVPAGVAALRCTSGNLNGTTLNTQSGTSNTVVAKIRTQEVSKDVTTNGLPEGDSAHGGMLEGFGLAADKLKLLGQIVCDQRWHGFVPTGSAIAVEGKDPFDDLFADVRSSSSELDEFKCASQNEKHTLMTEELGTWILDRLPR